MGKIPNSPHTPKPSHTPKPLHTPKPPHANFSKGAPQPTEGGGHKYLGMNFTAKQWKQFLNNICKSISAEIKRQEKRMKKAAEDLKKSIMGEPF